MAKKGGKKVNPADMTEAQKAAFQAQLDLQERALEMAQAQADRDYDSYLRRLEQQRADAAAAQRARHQHQLSRLISRPISTITAISNT